MARHKRKRRIPSAIISRAPQPERKRSLEVPLLWLAGAAFIGFPLLRDATADDMLRNRYGDLQSCECDYGGTRCTSVGGAWYGPWYARDATDRRWDDPGPGGQCRTAGSGHGGGHFGYRGGPYDGYLPPTGIERGYRGGFGGSGRVRAGS